MQNGSFGDTLSHWDRGLTQEANHLLGFYPADPVLLEQPGQRRLAQACGLGRGGRQRPQIQDPLGCHIVAHLEQLRIVAPKLLADAVAQAHALLLQLFSQARPLPQRDHGGVAGLDGSEQVRIRAQPTGRDPGIAPVVLSPSQADAVAQTLELLGIDRVHGEAAVQESIDNRPVRHLDGHCDRAWVARGRHQPVAQGRQTGPAVREVSLAHDLTGGIEKADLVLLRPQSTPANQLTMPSAMILALRDDTSRHDVCRSLYGRSKARLPTGPARGQPVGAHVPSWCSRHGVDAGCSRRAGPPGELTTRGYQTPAEGTVWTPPTAVVCQS